MAKRIKWADRIGETKEVQGITFTIVDNEGDTVVVEAGNDLYFMARKTWREGKFAKILRKLKPKFLGEQKEVQGITFKVVDIIEGKLAVEVKGDLFFMTPKTWEEGKFTVALRKLKPKYVNETKIIKGLLAKVVEFSKGKVTVVVKAEDGREKNFIMLANTWAKGVFKKLTKELKNMGFFKQVIYFLSVISNKPISADTIKKHVDTLENTFRYKEFKIMFNKLANIYHPDHGGNAKLFQKIHEVYKFQAPVLKRVEKTFSRIYEGEKYNEKVRFVLKLEKAKQAC